MAPISRPGISRLVLIFTLSTVLAACATYGERVAPVPIPGAHPGSISINGTEIIARGYVDPGRAYDAFGFGIREAGLLPVQFVIDNQSGVPVSIGSQSALLLDHEGNAWPILTAGTATDRVRKNVRTGETIASGARASLLTGLAGALAGAAIGVVAGGNIGDAAGRGAAAGATVGALGRGVTRYQELDREIYHDMLDKSLTDRPIKPGELAHGFLFFPGMPSEAGSVDSLRLTLWFNDESRTLTVPVLPAE